MIIKIIKILFIVILSFIVLSVISLLSFKVIFSQKKIESFEINDVNFDRHILIASQGSKFKVQLVKDIIDVLNDEKVYIKIIDVSLLNTINYTDWESIIIINAIERSKHAESVDQFIKRNNSGNKIILVATSGSGNFKVKGYNIDAISTASRMKNIDNIKNLVIDKINSVL